MNLEDAEIVRLFLSRDETAITHTAERYGSRLRSLSMRILDDRLTAEECENDTYHEAWNAIPPHKPETYLFAFLAAITRRISLNRLRDGKRLKRNALYVELTAEMEDCIPAPDTPAAQVDEKELIRTVNRFLEGLDEEKRNLFLRRYWYFDSVTMLAKRFSVSESKVKTTLFRCRKQLKEFLEKEGYSL